MLPGQPTFQAGFRPVAHQRRLLIISEASAKGRVGSWRPSWAPTPIPSRPTEALPSSSRSGDRILVVFQFLLRSRGSPAVGVLLRSHPGPVSLYTGGHFALTATGELTAEGVRKLICSSSGPSRALNLVLESSSVAKEGSRVTLSQRKPSAKLSSASSSARGKPQTLCLDKADGRASQSACLSHPPSPSNKWYPNNGGTVSECWVPAALAAGGRRGDLIYALWLLDVRSVPLGQVRAHRAQSRELSSPLQFHQATVRANRQHPTGPREAAIVYCYALLS